MATIAIEAMTDAITKRRDDCGLRDMKGFSNEER
jgi:hypothetical protein